MKQHKMVKVESCLLVVLLFLITKSSAANEGEHQLAEYDGIDLQRKARAAVPIGTNPWPGGVVPYKIDEHLFRQNERDELMEAIKTWNEETCLQLRPYQNGDAQWLRITEKGDGCVSRYVGFIRRQDEHTITLSANGCRFYGLYLHEIGHAIGMQHEHVRPDRESVLDVDLGGVPKNIQSFYDTIDQAKLQTYGSPYDLQSIMQYGPGAFSLDPKRSPLTVRDPALRHVLRPITSKDISFWDAKAMNLFYECAKKCKNPPPCEPPGFVDKNCVCQVPAVFSKRRCTDRLSKAKCKKMAKQLDCHTKTSYMTINCRNTCGFCYKASYAEIAKPKGKCDDAHVKCHIWQKRGECTRKPELMRDKCAKSCGQCTEESTDSCRDTYILPENCKNWAFAGECQSNPFWMAANCAASCGLCVGETGETAEKPGTCRDTYIYPENCKSWAASGECQANPIWMAGNCAASCGKCVGEKGETAEKQGTCRDTYIYPENCKSWAASGECQANPIWMAGNCAASCGKCPQKTSTLL